MQSVLVMIPVMTTQDNVNVRVILMVNNVKDVKMVITIIPHVLVS